MMDAQPKIGMGRCFVMGEVALTHDGSLGQAHALIDAIAAAGGDGVKFQMHIAEAESTHAEPFRVKFSKQDATRYDYWQRMAFTEEQWQGLAMHCRDRGTDFICSPFSIEAVDVLERIGQPFWKVASGEIGHGALMERMIATGRPVVLSSGMSPQTETDAAVARVKAGGNQVGVLQCTTAYPCQPEQVGLNMIPVFRERYGGWIGLSDHSATIYAGLAAVTLGIDILELHVTPSREMFGPDVPASVTTGELRHLVDGIRFIERMKASPIDKESMAAITAPLRAIFTRSLVARTALLQGHVLSRTDLALKKPGTGLPESRLGDMVGRRLRRAIEADELLSEDHLA
jgi:N,N'-diacetyllegionaminate synthase